MGEKAWFAINIDVFLVLLTVWLKGIYAYRKVRLEAYCSVV